MAAASEAKVKELIQGVGFQNTKAKYLKQVAATIIEVIKLDPNASLHV